MKPKKLSTSIPSACAAALALSGGLAAGADYAAAVKNLEPVAYYRLNTTNAVADLPAENSGSLGTAFNGVYQSMNTTRGLPGAIAGDQDTSVSIDGTLNQQMVVPYSAAYNPNGPFTVEFWAKPAVGSLSGNRTAVISMVNGQNAINANDRSGWCVRHSGADWQFLLGFDYSDGATSYHTTLAAPSSVLEDAWQHVVAVYTPDLVSIYINGVLAASQAPNKPLFPNTMAPLMMGDRGYTGWDYIGQLDEVALYPTALSEADIQAHYQNGTDASRTTPYNNLVLQKNPALYFRLNQPSVQLPVAVNEGSYGAAYDGTYLVGMTTGVGSLQKPYVAGFETTNVAAGFDGASGVVSIPGLPLNSDTVTMVCWIKPDGAQPARAGIMHQRKVTAPEVKATGLGFLDNGLGLSYNWEDHDTAYNFNPNFVPPNQAWTFVAVSVAPDSQVLFMGTANGLQAATNIYGITAHNFETTPMELGWDNYQATRRFRGAIDEFAIFDKTLTYEEIASLYNAALPGFLSFTRTPVDPVYEGVQVTLQAAFGGTQPITYQWRKGGNPIAGQTTTNLVLNSVTAADSGDYDVQVVVGGQTFTSPVNRLTVLPTPPILTQQPVSAERFVNGSVRFTAAAMGTQPLYFQWKHGNTAVPGATGPSLLLSDLQASDAGDYTLVVSNQYGIKEATVSLTVRPLPPTAYASAVLSAAPVGYWRLNETSGTNAFDYWGGHDGTYLAGVTNNVPGLQPADYTGFEANNTAYGFAGNASKVEIPPLNFNKATVTITAWINPRANQVDYAGIIFARGTTATGLDFKGTTGQLGYHWNDAGNTHGWASGLTPAVDQWNFVALVVELNQATMYLDDGTGLQSAVNSVAHDPAAFADPLRFGVDSPDGGRGYVGLIDEVAIFDRALSQDEIAALREAGVGGIQTPVPAAIVQQPRSQTVMAGTSTTLSAKVSGSLPITYQWQKGGADLPGATRSTLAFSSVTEADAGTYRLVVSQGATKVTSEPAILAVNPKQAILTNDLVLHLKFDGDYTDASGRQNNGTPQGSPEFVAGKIGTGALKYETVLEGGAVAKANYVTLGTPEDLAVGPGQNFSVAFWIKFTGAPGDLPFLGNTENSHGDPGINFAPSWEQGSWSWYIGPTGAGAWQGNGLYSPVKNNMDDGRWHHLVHTFDRANLAITYLDGVAVHERLIAANAEWDLNVPGKTWSIGQAGAGGYAVGGVFEMDDLGFWRRVLSETEVQAMYLVGNYYGRSFDTPAPAQVSMEIVRTAAGVELKWTSGTLEVSDRINGGFAPVTGAAPPSFKVEPANGTKFYRVKL